jgi:hypothetical protein
VKKLPQMTPCNIKEIIEELTIFRQRGAQYYIELFSVGEFLTIFKKQIAGRKALGLAKCYLAMALTTSVCLFMTMTAAVPKPVWAAIRPSKSIKTLSQTLQE